MTEVMPANLGCFGVADNLDVAIRIKKTGVRMLGDESRSNPAGIVFHLAADGGAIFIWFVTVAADYPGASFQDFCFM